MVPATIEVVERGPDRYRPGIAAQQSEDVRDLGLGDARDELDGADLVAVEPSCQLTQHRIARIVALPSTSSRPRRPRKRKGRLTSTTRRCPATASTALARRGWPSG